MRRKNEKIDGRIIIEGGVNVWPHELHTATALANAGYTVRFIPASTAARSADAYLNNTMYEFKSPEGSNIKSVERNIVAALNHQSPNIVIDSFRMKRVRDKSILSFLVSRLKAKKGIKRIIFVNRDGKAIDINELV